MSSTVNLRTSLLFDSVGPGQHLQRVDGPLVCALLDRNVGELAVARDELLFGVGNSFHQRSRNAPRELDVLGPQSPRAVDGSAALDRGHFGAGERHEVTALRPDLLGAVVARRV